VSALLSVRDLRVTFEREGRPLAAVDGVDLELGSGETLALVGESGSGKTLTALALLGVLPAAARMSGTLRWRGADLATLAPSERRALNGRELAFVSQEPASALDPVFTIGEQVAEVLRVHARLGRAAAWQRAVACLAEVGLAAPEERAHAYPHELSGGQRQRAALAMALACGPALLVADEPTSALDVTLQAEILALLARLVRARDMALVLITHDLALVAEATERVAVMYAGRVVEEAPVHELFERPAHPYTAALLRSRPRADAAPEARLAAIPGVVPELGSGPAGCRFAPRCALARERCSAEAPPLETLAEPGRRSACFFAAEVRP